MNKDEFKDLSKEDLELKLVETKKTIMNFRFQQVYGQLNDTSLLRKRKKDVARIKTCIHEKSI